MKTSRFPRRPHGVPRTGEPRLVTALAVAFLLGGAGVGCGSGGDSGGGSAPGASGGGVAADDAGRTGPEAAVGDASVAVGTGPLDGTWFRCGGLANTYRFAGDRFEQFIAYYSTPDCSGEPRRDDGGVSPDEPYTSGSFVLGEAVTTAEGMSARAIDMTTDTFLGESIFENIRVTNHDIVFTERAGQLVFGRFPGPSPEERATELDFDAPYVRR